MHVRLLSMGTTALLTTLLGASALAAPAEAAPAGCGQVITQNTTLTADIGPCGQGGGLIIGANSVILDLGGHTVSGKANANGDAGILIEGHRGVVVRNGTVLGFGAGVAIVGGARNTISGLIVRNNIGGGDFGDGIAIISSNDNTVTGNYVTGNGPYDGIGVLGDTSDPNAGSARNVIADNHVASNNVPTSRFGPNQDDGIRLEGPNATDNVVRGNTVVGSGLDGIAVFADQQTGLRNTGNQILDNTVEYNGFHKFAHRKGDGIILFGLPSNPSVGGADSTLVQGNEVHGNAAYGIQVNSQHNTIRDNDARGNATMRGSTALDVTDINPDCDQNTWIHNRFTTFSPRCVRGHA